MTTPRDVVRIAAIGDLRATSIAAERSRAVTTPITNITRQRDIVLRYCTGGPIEARWTISMRVPQGSVM